MSWYRVGDKGHIWTLVVATWTRPLCRWNHVVSGTSSKLLYTPWFGRRHVIPQPLKQHLPCPWQSESRRHCVTHGPGVTTLGHTPGRSVSKSVSSSKSIEHSKYYKTFALKQSLHLHVQGKPTLTQSKCSQFQITRNIQEITQNVHEIKSNALEIIRKVSEITGKFYEITIF